jgi:putative CocE/NonD family hydrolase
MRSHRVSLRLLLMLPLLALAFVLVHPTSRADFRAPQDQPRFDVITQKNVMIPMRDGVPLAVDLYLPGKNGAVATGKFPTILERTPYDKNGLARTPNYYVTRGYVFVAADVRGRYASEGKWRPNRDDGNDGYDTAKWIGAQPWSDGGIGTMGTSYDGSTQHAMAIANPPFLKTMIPADAMSDYGRYGIRHAGAFELRFLNWIMTLGAPIGSVESRDPILKAGLTEIMPQVNIYAKNLPLRTATTPLHLAPEYEAWLVESMHHGDYDSYWKDMGASVVDHIPEYKDIPVYHLSGWYDSWALQVANLNYVELSKHKKSLQRLIMGPWTHGGRTMSHAGDAEFGPDGAIDFNAFQTRWFDRWLKGIENGVDKEPPVRIFVMGGGDAHKTPEGRIFVGGHWRNENEWPLKRAVYTPYYLHSNGELSTRKPANEPPVSFTFDPHHPVPTLGGNISSEGTLMARGGMDQSCKPTIWTCEDSRPLSARNDVVVFQTPPLDQDVEVTGPLVVKLWASSQTVDTDFTAKLVDVYPSNKDFPRGYDMNVGDGIIRARYRTSFSHAELMKPGQIYEFTIELYPTSLVFAKGHRIRVDISSSNFPRFDVNPNTGEPLNDNRRWAITVNTIYHDALHPSQILLPIIPAPKN